MRLEMDSRKRERIMAEKKGESERTSSWAAKRRCSVPTQRVTIGEVIVLGEQEGEVSFSKAEVEVWI